MFLPEHNEEDMTANPRERVKYIIDLIKLVLPTLRPGEHINPISENPPSIDFRKLFNFKEPEN